MRNQSCSISGRGRLIEERNRSTNSNGKKPCTASPDPARSPMKEPSPAKPSAISIPSRMIAGTPMRPDLKSMPAAKPAAR